jgi:aminopeptidase N
VLDSSLARALCWSATWDMCRDAELSAADFVSLVLAGVGAETDLTAVGTVLAQARTAIEYYAPPATREHLNERFSRGLALLLKQSAPASDHQLAFARALISSAWNPPVIDLIQAWANGTEAPAGLAVDTDLRWQIITQLARRGVIGEAEVAAELGNDATASGAERAAGARAALPTAQAKDWAWQAATKDPGTPNETHYQICSQFWQVGQDEVLRRYVRQYLDVALAISEGRDGWAHRSSAIRQHVLGLLFPRPLMDRSTLQLLDLWLHGTALSDSVSRLVSERRDDAERALRCQEAAHA